MVDRIAYEAPFGLIGPSIDRLLLKGYLINLIAQRNDFTKQSAES